MNDLTPYIESALAEYIEVTLVLNPLAQGDRLVVRVAPVGTLADLISALVPDELERDHISAFLGGDYIEPELWTKVRPKSGASVYLRVVPQDPVSIISILATQAAPTIAGAILGAGASGFALGVAGAAISMAITYADGDCEYRHANPDAIAIHKETKELMVLEVKTARILSG